MKETVVTPFTVLRVRLAFPPTAQQPRNSATELFTRSFCLIILGGKGDIIAVQQGAVQCVPWLQLLSPGYRQVVRLHASQGTIPLLH